MFDVPNCNSAFCKKCMEEYWNRFGGNKCPNLCERPHFEVLEESEKQVLANIRVACINQEFRCNDVVTYDFLESHEDICSLAEFLCKNFSQCGTNDTRANLRSHQRQCGTARSKCEFFHKQNERSDHPTQECSDYLLVLPESKENKEALEIEEQGK